MSSGSDEDTSGSNEASKGMNRERPIYPMVAHILSRGAHRLVF